jgi:hypothetical protein
MIDLDLIVILCITHGMRSEFKRDANKQVKWLVIYIRM